MAGEQCPLPVWESGARKAGGGEGSLETVPSPYGNGRG
jgi:hypothetical protein